MYPYDPESYANGSLLLVGSPLLDRSKRRGSDEEVLQKRIPTAVTEEETFSMAIHGGRGSCGADQAPS